MRAPDAYLDCRGHVLQLERTVIMGILNVTPDSFSDGGLWLDPDAAIGRGLEMVEQGAGIVDVGGESTRPGAAHVPEEEELGRVIPVVEALSAEGVLVSIDTRKAAVAEKALAAGAAIVNDTLGEETDRTLDKIAAESGAALVIMHSRGTPSTMRELNHYSDLVTEVRDFLARRAEEAVSAGVDPRSIALDPGIGFAKDAGQNLTLLSRLERLHDLPAPLLVGTSRKSFIGATLDLPESERLEGSLATLVLAISKGARIIRVHDVTGSVRAARMTDAVMAAV